MFACFKGEKQQQQHRNAKPSMVTYSTESQSANSDAIRTKTNQPVGVHTNAARKRAHPTSTNQSTHPNLSNARNFQPNNAIQQSAVMPKPNNQGYVLKLAQKSSQVSLSVMYD